MTRLTDDGINYMLSTLINEFSSLLSKLGLSINIRTIKLTGFLLTRIQSSITISEIPRMTSYLMLLIAMMSLYCQCLATSHDCVHCAGQYSILAVKYTGSNTLFIIIRSLLCFYWQWQCWFMLASIVIISCHQRSCL